MNPKITKLLAEREKNSEKIAKLNARNDEIDKQVTELEKRSWKGLGLSARLLLVLLLLVMFGMGIYAYSNVCTFAGVSDRSKTQECFYHFANDMEILKL